MSTYNSVDWLEKVIWGFSAQNYEADYEVIVADDGSTKETKEKIEALRDETGLKIVHVWHEDRGFQKSQILNKAIVASSGDYLVFTDGDCIPRRDFLTVHAAFAEKGFFLSGGYFKLPMESSKAITKSDIYSAKCFDYDWLRKNGLEKTGKARKLKASGFSATIFNAMTPTKATWNGHNASGWKKDLLAVNGFNEKMQYGGQDRELGERLFNLGLKSKQIRYSAIVIHLDHARGYVDKEKWEQNNQIRRDTKKTKLVRTPHGIEK